MNIYLSLHSTTGIVHSSSLSENALSLVRCCPVCVNTWWELTGALESLTGRCSRDVTRLFFSSNGDDRNDVNGGAHFTDPTLPRTRILIHTNHVQGTQMLLFVIFIVNQAIRNFLFQH